MVMREERGFWFLEGDSSLSSSMSSFVVVVLSSCSVEVLSFVGVDLVGDLSSKDGEYGLVVVVFWGSVALLRFGGGGRGKNLAVVVMGVGVANSVGAVVGVRLVESSSSSPL